MLFDKREAHFSPSFKKKAVAFFNISTTACSSAKAFLSLLTSDCSFKTS